MKRDKGRKHKVRERAGEKEHSMHDERQKKKIKKIKRNVRV